MLKNIVWVALLLVFFNCDAGKVVVDGGDSLVLSILARSNDTNDFIVTFQNQKKESIDAEIPKNQIDMSIAPFNQVSLIMIRKKAVKENEAAVTYLYKKKQGKWIVEQFDQFNELPERTTKKKKCVIL
ncbi:MAG TPA: hypothetical protein VHO47_02965 [Candidatus Babeliales bacterium]|nr:hypothetical protein [Candidatus Babeliales bacterium]